MDKPKRRTPTNPGLGDSGLRARHESPETLPSTPPVSGLRDRVDPHAPHESIPASELPFSGNVPIERAEKISTRRPRSSRPPIRVDDVGDIAVGIAAKANLKKTP